MFECDIKFPNDFRRDSISSSLHLNYGKKTKKELEKVKIEVSVAGRMMMRRIMGKASFVVLQDGGGRIQLYLVYADLPKGVYCDQFKNWNLGDILGVRGRLFKTQTGELTIRCYELRLLTKALRPFPSKFQGFTDSERCYRQRYLDLIVNDKTRSIFKTRSKVIASIRTFMLKHDFMEVETPMMHLIPGGAFARPFITYHNALNLNMYLRVAPELYLKRLVIGGFERVFEINRNFRNEGISVLHNPEFTMMEFYMAYADYRDLIELTENLFFSLVKKIFKKSSIFYDNEKINFEKPFKKISMRKAIEKYSQGIKAEDFDSFDKTTFIAKSLGVKIEKNWGIGRIISEIFEKRIQKHLLQPTFITEYPVEVSPLARRNDLNFDIADRFEFFVGGLEIGNGFSELNDPKEQEERFKKRFEIKPEDGEEGIFNDQEYLTALEYGLPPTAGMGIGIDRLIMLFSDAKNIRDVILFPILRPSIK